MIILFMFQTNAQNDTIYAKKLLKTAELLKTEGKYTESNTTALQAAEIFQKNEKWQLWYEAYYIIFSNGWISKEYESSTAILQKGLQQLPKNEYIIRGKIFQFSGYFTERAGNIWDATTYYEKSLEYFKKAKDSSRIDAVLGNLGLIYIQKGDYTKAQEYAQIAIDYSNTKSTLWKNTKALGQAYFYADDFENARKTYTKAQQIIDENDGTYALFEAEIEYELENYTTALTNAQKAIQLANDCRNNPLSTSRRCVYNLVDAKIVLGKIYLEQTQPNKALSQFTQALKLMTSSGNLRELGKLHILIGDAHFEMHKYDAALEHYQLALQEFIPNFHETDFEKNPPQHLWTTEIWLMEIFRNKGNCFLEKYKQTAEERFLRLANENYEAAVTSSEEKRLDFTEPNSKLELGSYANEFYEELVNMKFMLHAYYGDEKYLLEAFQIAQRANAFVLRELVSEQQAFTIAEVSEDTLQLFQKHKKEIALLEQKKEDTATLKRTLKKLMDTKDRFQQLKKEIYKNYPEFEKLRNDLDGISVAALQKNIHEQEVFIKYFLGTNDLYIFTITKNDFYADKIALPTNFKNLLSQYRQAISDINFINKTPKIAEKQYLQTAHLLYKIALETSLKHTEKDSINALIIVPDGWLASISFQALLTEKSDSWTTIKNTVIHKYAVSYQYYCKINEKLPQESSQKHNFTSFGVASDTEITTSDTEKLAVRSQLSKLSFSDDEALELATLMQGTSWIDENATKANFLKNAQNTTGIHLATHALVNIKNPNNSALVFTKTNDSISNVLRLDEIYNHNFNSNMITLSACNTGFGTYQKGEGLQSLARAFNFANIPSVTATLWNIPDASSATIMKLYYENLQKGHPKNVALQKAQIAYFENDEISSPASRLPFYWSAWIHIGDETPIHFEQPKNNNLLLLLMLAIVIIVMTVVRFIRRKIKVV